MANRQNFILASVASLVAGAAWSWLAVYLWSLLVSQTDIALIPANLGLSGLEAKIWHYGQSFLVNTVLFLPLTVFCHLLKPRAPWLYLLFVVLGIATQSAFFAVYSDNWVQTAGYVLVEIFTVLIALVAGLLLTQKIIKARA